MCGRGTIVGLTRLLLIILLSYSVTAPSYGADPECEIIVMLNHGDLVIPPPNPGAQLSEVQVNSPELSVVLQQYNVQYVSKVFPNFDLADTMRVARTGENVRVTDLSKFYYLEVPTPEDVQPLIDALDSLTNVAIADARSNSLPQADQSVPTDPGFEYQWGLHNTGQFGGTEGEDIGWLDAISINAGSDIKIGVFDYGVDWDEPDLTGKIGGDTEIDPSLYYHGTRIACILAAHMNNDYGIVGINPAARIHSRRVDLPDAGEAAFIDDMNSFITAGCPFINISMQYKPSGFFTLFYRDLYMLNYVVAASAGNRNANVIHYPASLPWTVAIGAIGPTGLRWEEPPDEGSNYGPELDFVAPGEYLETCIGGVASATSYATPFYIGIGSLLLSERPDLYGDDIFQILVITADDKGSAGWDEEYGYGALNAYEALRAITGPSTLTHIQTNGGTSHSITNIDTQLFLDVPGTSFQPYYAERHEVRKATSFGKVYETEPQVWGRSVSTRGFGADNPNYGVGWCAPVSGSITTESCVVRTYVYELFNIFHESIGWVPCSPSEVRFAVSVLGVVATVPPVEITNPSASSPQIFGLAPIEGSVDSEYIVNGIGVPLDSFTVEWGEGVSPSVWYKNGVAQTCRSCAITDDSLATWNTGMLQAGQYTVRISAYYGAEVYWINRDVEVIHRSEMVEHGNPNAFDTIQEGIEWAEMGDTLYVYGTRYDENIAVHKTVYIQAVEPDIEIGGIGDNPVITITGHDYPCYIDGFKIQHENASGYSNGHGIKIDNASPVISNCKITNNVSIVGAGAKVEGDSRPVFSNCEFSGNVGGGVAVIGDTNDRPIAEFYNCRFIGNEGPKGAAATVEYDPQNPLDGSQDQLKFVNCIFDGNLSDPTPNEYGTVGLQACYNVLFDHCTFTNNDPATSGYVAGVIYGDFEGSITNCTIADNKENSSQDYFAGVERSYVGQPGPLVITNTIIAFNKGPAVAGGNASVSQSNFYGNLDWESFPTDADWATVPLGLEMISEDPAFCNAQNGDYHIYAFSPCAPNVSFYEHDLMGSYEIGCVPPANIELSIDSMRVTDFDTVMVACPQGDENYTYQVVVDFEDSVITRTIEPDEITIHFATTLDSILVFDEDGVIDAASSANSSNGYRTTVSHKWFGGYGRGMVSVFLNGVLLDTTSIYLRTYDVSSDGGPPDGIVELADFSSFGLSYPSPPKPYVPQLDFNADSLIDNVDFSLFGQHWTHESPYQMIQGVSPQTVQQTDFNVALDFTDEVIESGKRELRVDVTLQDITTFKAMCVSLKNENERLEFREWLLNERYPTPIMVAPITRDGVDQLFMGIIGSKITTGPTQYLGTLVFDVYDTQALELADDDFQLLVGSVLLASGDRGQLRGVSKQTQGDIKHVFSNYLSQNVPNPFNPLTTIEYSIKGAAHVELKVFNVSGQLVRVLENSDKTPNVYRVSWDGRDHKGNRVASGVYFYRLTAGEFTATKKMVLLQ